MWRDELDAALGQLRVERVAVVSTIADDARRQPPHEAVFQGVGDEADLTGSRTGDSNGERKTSAVCEYHDLGVFPFASEADGETPFFAPAKVASR